MKQIAVTGLGVMAPHGDDAAKMFAALMRGESAVRPIFPQLPKPAVAASVEFDPAPWFDKLHLAGVDRVSQLAVAGADRALADSGLDLSALDRERIGVYVGCGMGGAQALDTGYLNPARIPPLTIPAFMINAPAAQVAMRWRLQGPALTYSVACASSSLALAEAAKAIRLGEVDVAIVGGCEALLVPHVVMAWQAMRTLASFQPGEEAQACKPFSANRTGFALGEGAAFLVLESNAHALSRQARRYALLAGWGVSCDATHLTKPDAAGQQRAIRQALKTAELGPEDIGYCNAHGTATLAGDLAEAESLAAIWGPALADLRVSSTKGMHGHLLGGAGALEAVITILALYLRQLPPNAHCDQPDPACPLPLVLQTELAAPHLKAALSSSFAFGGTNSVLAFTSV